MKSVKYFLLCLCVVLLICYLLYQQIGVAEESYIYAVPPVNGRLEIVGDHIYFIKEYGVISKYAKDSLTEVDTANIYQCYNLRYSDYLDRIIVLADKEPCKMVILNYESMLPENEIVFGGQIADIMTLDDKVYIAWDDSGIAEGEPYDVFNLPRYTGVVSQMDLDSWSEDWHVNIATFPEYIDTAGQYVVTSSEEVIRFPDNDFDFKHGKIINIIDKETRRVRESYVAHTGFAPIEYDGGNRLFVGCGSWLPGYAGPDAGLTIIYLDTLDWEHVHIEGPEALRIGEWAVDCCDLVGDKMYMAYANAAEIQDATTFGIYDLNTGEKEDIQIPGISLGLCQIVIDGSNVYLTAYDFAAQETGLLKYTMD